MHVPWETFCGTGIKRKHHTKIVFKGNFFWVLPALPVLSVGKALKTFIHREGRVSREKKREEGLFIKTGLGYLHALPVLSVEKEVQKHAKN